MELQNIPGLSIRELINHKKMCVKKKNRGILEYVKLMYVILVLRIYCLDDLVVNVIERTVQEPNYLLLFCCSIWSDVLLLSPAI